MEIELLYNCIKEIENGKSIDEVAKYNHVKPRILRLYLLQDGGQKGKEIILDEIQSQLPLTIEEISDRVNEGKSLRDIAEECGVSHYKFTELFYRYKAISGQKIQSDNKVKYKRTDLDVNKIINEYRNGKSIIQIAEENNTSTTTIRIRIDNYKSTTGEDVDQEHKNEINRIRNIRKKAKNDKNRKIEMDRIREQENKKIKLIEQIIREYGYFYEQLLEIANRKGYEFSKLIYYQALNNIKRDEERDE